jgi:hypothetical protein
MNIGRWGDPPGGNMKKSNLSKSILAHLMLIQIAYSMPVRNQCVVDIEKYHIAWIDKARPDANKIVHGSLIAIKSRKTPNAFEIILPHIAISESAYSSICKMDKFIATLYPEPFIYGYRQWKLMKIDSEAYVCYGNLKDCIDSTKIFESRAKIHWESVFKSDLTKIKLLRCLEQACSDEYFSSLNIKRAQADSILKDNTLSISQPK